MPPSAAGAHLLVGGIGGGLVQLAGDPLEEVGVALAELLPLGVLGLFHKAQQVLFIEGEFAVVVFRFAQQPGVGQQH